VYGGPHAQNVLNSWSGANWDQVLAHKGFVIWQVDNRGTSGRGHAFEAPVHKQLGVVELEDQKMGVEYLLKLGFVDPKRIGVNGWSYGGFMTLNCLLNAPDVFAAGIAGAPVTNFKFYDTIYTERYMDLPQDNAAGYQKTALPLVAGNLKGRLMIVHNIDDDNVLFQNSMQMMDALQRAGKMFEFMLYPQKAHGVIGPASRQMRMAMTDFFERTLLTPALSGSR
jgi:dipeptidyl-peptidase-4